VPCFRQGRQVPLTHASSSIPPSQTAELRTPAKSSTLSAVRLADSSIFDMWRILLSAGVAEQNELRAAQLQSHLEIRQRVGRVEVTQANREAL